MVAKTPGGVTGKGFLPGHSGNPGGRPKGLAERVRKMTRNGEDILAIVTSVAQGEKINGRRPPLAYRLEACKILLDRGWGRPAQAMEHGFGGGPIETEVRFYIPENTRDRDPALPDGDTVDMDNGENGR